MLDEVSATRNCGYANPQRPGIKISAVELFYRVHHMEKKKAKTRFDLLRIHFDPFSEYSDNAAVIFVMG